MKNKLTPLIIIAIAVFGFILAGPLFVVEEGQQAIVVRMGQIVGDARYAGLHVKIPFIDEVIRYPRRIMAWDGEQNNIPTLEKQFIWVDVTARWRIADPKKFYTSIATAGAAYSKLGEIIDSEVKAVTAENYFRESVRNTDLLVGRESTVEDLGVGDQIDTSLLQSSILETTFEHIEKGRRQLAEEILERSRKVVPEYGIELIDVVTRQIRYSNELTPSVYARMIKERNQIAQNIRSEGEAKKSALLGKMENDRMAIRSQAYKEAEDIRGTADARVARITAAAYGRDQGFYDFWRATQSYRTTLPKFEKTLTTDMNYFRYLYSPR